MKRIIAAIMIITVLFAMGLAPAFAADNANIQSTASSKKKVAKPKNVKIRLSKDKDVYSAVFKWDKVKNAKKYIFKWKTDGDWSPKYRTTDTKSAIFYFLKHKNNSTVTVKVRTVDKDGNESEWVTKKKKF